MASTIANGSNTPLNVQTGTIPDVEGGMRDWFQPMVFTQVAKDIVGYQNSEAATPINFRGVMQPFSERQLMLKPEGQRAWTWLWLHSDPVLTLQVDEVVNYLGVQTRVMSRKDYSIYGYVEYQLVQDWTGSGPGVTVPYEDQTGTNTLANGANTPLNVQTGTIPDVEGGMRDWFQPMIFTRVLKQIIGFQEVETLTQVNFVGVIQPFTERKLYLKPEGQRSWTWLQLHADSVLTLNVDEIVFYRGLKTRVMSRRDYTIYGYIEYHLVQDWTESTALDTDLDNGNAFDTDFFDLDGGDATSTDYTDLDGGDAYANVV